MIRARRDPFPVPEGERRGLKLTHHDPQMRPLRSRRAKPLSGILALPGDAAIAQRALIIAAMALGESSIENLPETAGTTATINALRALGAVIEKRGAVWTVSGLGADGLLEPQVPLDFGTAPEAAALLMGAAGVYPFVSNYAGEDGPALRPLLEALSDLGVTVLEDNAGHRPVALRGPRTPVSGTFRTSNELKPTRSKLPISSAVLNDRPAKPSRS